jgi:hypothetical protein
MKFLTQSLLTTLILSFAITPAMMQAAPPQFLQNALNKLQPAAKSAANFFQKLGYQAAAPAPETPAQNQPGQNQPTQNQTAAQPAAPAPVQQTPPAPIDDQARIELALYDQLLAAAQEVGVTQKLASMWQRLFTRDQKQATVNNFSAEAKGRIFEHLAQKFLNDRVACPFAMPTGSNYSQSDTFFLLLQRLRADNQEFCQALNGCLGKKDALAIGRIINIPAVRDVLTEMSPAFATQFNFGWKDVVFGNAKLNELRAQLGWRMNTDAAQEKIVAHQNEARPVQASPILENKNTIVGVIFALLAATGIIFFIKNFMEMKKKKAKKVAAHKDATK